MRSTCFSIYPVVGTTAQHFDQYSRMSTEPPNQSVQRMSAAPSVEIGCLGVALIADLYRSEWTRIQDT
jgi:hypothetical protein